MFHSNTEHCVFEGKRHTSAYTSKISLWHKKICAIARSVFLMSFSNVNVYSLSLIRNFEYTIIDGLISLTRFQITLKIAQKY